MYSFKESEELISKLKSINDFFESELLRKITIRTQTIVDLFKNESLSLDPNSLSLFHTQFTESLIDLLDKVKHNIQTQSALIEFKIKELTKLKPDDSGIKSSDLRDLIENKTYLNIPKMAETRLSCKPIKHLWKCTQLEHGYYIHNKLLVRLKYYNYDMLCLGTNSDSSEYYFQINNTLTQFVLKLKSKMFVIVKEIIFPEADKSEVMKYRNEIEEVKSTSFSKLTDVLIKYYDRLDKEINSILIDDISVELNVLTEMINLNGSIRYNKLRNTELLSSES